MKITVGPLNTHMTESLFVSVSLRMFFTQLKIKNNLSGVSLEEKYPKLKRYICAYVHMCMYVGILFNTK